MELVPVNCNGCGAALDVGPDTRFVTCAQCGARLAVKRSESAAYTEILEGLERKTDAIAEQLAEIQRQNELERIDREWEQERRQWFTRNKDGSMSEPSAAMGVVMAIVAAVFGVFWVGFAASMGAPCMFMVMGGGICGLAVVLGFAAVQKAKHYEEARLRYRKRRAAATDEPPK